MTLNPLDLSGASVAEIVAWASDAPLLDPGEEARLQDQCVADAAALEQLVRTHLRVAIDEAIRSRGLGLSQDRLVRMAARALVEAAPSFDPRRHGSFHDYAQEVVRTAIDRAMAS